MFKTDTKPPKLGTVGFHRLVVTQHYDRDQNTFYLVETRADNGRLGPMWLVSKDEKVGRFVRVRKNRAGCSIRLDELVFVSNIKPHDLLNADPESVIAEYNTAVNNLSRSQYERTLDQ